MTFIDTVIYTSETNISCKKGAMINDFECQNMPLQVNDMLYRGTNTDYIIIAHLDAF